MKTEIDEIRNQKPPSIVISKPPSIIISKVNETTPEKEIKQLSQNVKESEPNKFNTKEYLIGLFSPVVIILLIGLATLHLDQKHNDWEDKMEETYGYNWDEDFEDWDWDDWKDDVGPEPIDLDLEHELAILSILFFIYILAIIYVFTKKKNNLGLGLLTPLFLIFMLILFNF